ncbi:MAG: hypothetical protein Q4G30_03285 [Actinomycetaceae bacterium]|nr:hypothetical protein [Actinomycetaceae bacterium]
MKNGNQVKHAGFIGTFSVSVLAVLVFAIAAFLLTEFWNRQLILGICASFAFVAFISNLFFANQWCFAKEITFKTRLILILYQLFGVLLVIAAIPALIVLWLIILA